MVIEKEPLKIMKNKSLILFRYSLISRSKEKHENEKKRKINQEEQTAPGHICA